MREVTRAKRQLGSAPYVTKSCFVAQISRPAHKFVGELVMPVGHILQTRRRAEDGPVIFSNRVLGRSESQESDERTASPFSLTRLSTRRYSGLESGRDKCKRARHRNVVFADAVTL